MIKEYPVAKLHGLIIERIKFIESLIDQNQKILNDLTHEHSHLAAMAMAYEGGPEEIKPRRNIPAF